MSGVRSEPLVNGERAKASRPPVATGHQLLAIVLWLLGCVTTYQVVAILLDGRAWPTLLAATFLTQVILTALESPTLRGRPNPISLIVLLLDALINAGGVYVLLDGRAEQLPMVQMAADVAGASGGLSPAALAGIALLLGFILAAAPEAVWRWKA